MSSVTPSSKPYEAYKFVTSRLYTLAGYMLAPITYDAMLFYLPPFELVTTRAVRIRDRLWELWSPNSTTYAFYPGLSDKSIIRGTELEKKLRRCDGHLGRFDPTISPQHFEKERPWLGFMKKAMDHSLPENSPLHDVWKPNAVANSGKFTLSFINAISTRFTQMMHLASTLEIPSVAHPEVIPRRPAHLTTNAAVRLNSVGNFDDAVDILASVQRDFKELDAWNRMALSIRGGRRSAEEITIIPRADDTLVGVWINGSEKSDASWLLRSRVPCFIVHESDGDEDWKRLERLPIQCVLMTARTSISTSDARICSYERRLVENGQDLRSLVKIDTGMSRYEDIPRSMRSDRSRSSSYGQGFINGQYCDPRVTNVAFDLDQPTLVEKDGKIQPPKVMAAELKGAWTVWYEDTLDDDTRCIRLRSKSYRGHGGQHVYFDRQNKRQIFLDEAIEIPRHLDAEHEIFGVPAPRLPYLFSPDDIKTKHYTASVWIYAQRDPQKGDVGRVFDGSIGQAPPSATMGASPATSVSLGSENDYVEGEQGDSEMFLTPQDYETANKEPKTPEVIVEEEHTPTDVTMFESQEPDIPLGKANERRSSSPDRRWNPSEGSRGRDRVNHRLEEYGRGRNRSRSTSRRRSYRGSYSRHYSPRRWDTRNHYSPERRSRSPRRRPAASRPLSPYRRRSPRPSSSYQRRSSPRREYSPARKDYNFRSRSTSPASQDQLRRRSLVARINQFTEVRAKRTVNNSDVTMDLSLAPIARSTLDLFPIPNAPPVTTKKRIATGGQSRFLVIWNIPVIFCWNDVVTWLKFVVTLCIRVRLVQILRTNEMGYQVFWLVFKTEEQAQKFRGVVARRYTERGHLVECDYVSEDEYSSIAGQCIDRWDDKIGYVNGQIGSAPFNEEARPYLSHFNLARRLGVAYVPRPPKSRRRNKHVPKLLEMASTADGGAL